VSSSRRSSSPTSSRIVDITRLPRRQATQPFGFALGWAGNVQAAQVDETARRDPEVRANREVRVIDDDLTRGSGDIGIAPLLDCSDDPALCADHIGGAPGLTVDQTHDRLRRPLHRLGRRRVNPIDPGIGDSESLARPDLHHRLGGLGFRDRRLDFAAVIAFRPQDRRGVIGGLTGATAGLEPAGYGTIGLTDGVGDFRFKGRLHGPFDTRPSAAPRTLFRPQPVRREPQGRRQRGPVVPKSKSLCAPP